MTIASVNLWGRPIGAVVINGGGGGDKPGDNARVATFQYDPDFAQSGIEVSPLMMPLSSRVYQFPALPTNTFHGLPGLLADSLPDKFGNQLIDQWLASVGRTPESFNAVERLCYTGARGMGALEYLPVIGARPRTAAKIEIDRLVALASDILSERNQLRGNLMREGRQREKALKEILAVGTSAGGARAKAVIALNRESGEVRSGQVNAGEGFDYWLLKFDGVTNNKDKELDDPKGYGAVEYAYYLMARAAGISMSECRLLEENGRRHFMTKRFDRFNSDQKNGEKLHMQSLCGLAHFDFNAAGAYSYEQALLTIRTLGLPMAAIEEQFRRMAFNIIARNQDDHVKNIAFLMDKNGTWSLAPAFDVTYSYNPLGAWTSSHQMTMNGKRDGFTIADFQATATSAMMKRGRAVTMIEEVTKAVKRWPEFAAAANVSEAWQVQIQRAHRLI